MSLDAPARNNVRSIRQSPTSALCQQHGRGDDDTARRPAPSITESSAAASLRGRAAGFRLPLLVRRRRQLAWDNRSLLHGVSYPTVIVTGAGAALTPQGLTACTVTTYVPGATVPAMPRDAVGNCPVKDPVTLTT